MSDNIEKKLVARRTLGFSGFIREEWTWEKRVNDTYSTFIGWRYQYTINGTAYFFDFDSSTSYAVEKLIMAAYEAGKTDKSAALRRELGIP